MACLILCDLPYDPVRPPTDVLSYIVSVSSLHRVAQMPAKLPAWQAQRTPA
jgi:hypothetical protein